jgi:hypothetical protein
MNLPHYPATLRNRDPILSVIQQHLPQSGSVLETASGTGEHLTYFAQNLPKIQWQPSDKIDDLFWAIQTRSQNLPNVRLPQVIDVTKSNSLSQKYTAIFNINMIHIAPWESCQGLFELASTTIEDNGFVYMYGPYKRNGQHTSSSNETFDMNLRSQNPLWGVRNMEDVITIATQFGFIIRQIEAMPANNYSLVFYRQHDLDTNL